MQRQLIPVAASFAVVLVAYMTYALVVVPWIEPSAGRMSESAGGGDSSASSAPIISEYHELLARCFGPDSWVLQHPKMLESDHGILLIKDYDRIRPEAIELAPFAMILFPSAAVRTDKTRAGEAILLEAPRAVLVFDRPLDLGRGRIGQLKTGQLNGPVVIHSDQKLPGPDDDLRITTRNVELREDRIFTPEPVEFRLGPNFGKGRELVMRLLPSEEGRATGRKGPNVGGLHYVELVREVQMQFELAGEGLLPRRDSARPGRKAVEASAVGGTSVMATKPAGPPVRITSQGPFRYDVQTQEATFRHQVVVQRVNPDGRPDQMTCDLFGMAFEPRGDRRDKSAGSLAAAPAGSPPRMPALQPRRLRATGNPIIVHSPSTGAAARCQRLEYDLKTRRVTLDDADRVMLDYRDSHAEAPHLSYQPSDGQTLGLVEAVGPGELRTNLDGDPQRPFRAQWTREFRVRPHEDRQLVSVLGQAALSYAGMGTLSADEIWLWLHEQGAARATPANGVGSASPSADSGRAAQSDSMLEKFQPDRMVAINNVVIDSPQLTGRPGRFEVWFQPVAAASIDNLQAGEHRDGPEEVAAAPVGQIPVLPASGPQSPRTQPSQQRFDMAGELLRVNVHRSGPALAVSDVTISGQARFSESVTAKPDEKPLVLVADDIHVRGADTPRTVADLVGRPARVEARGLTLLGAKIQFDRAANKLSINGPGETIMAADRDLQGRPRKSSQPINIAWQERMEFDGRAIQYRGQVVARTAQQQLNTAEMDIHIDPPILFAQPPRNSQRVDLSKIACRGGVLLENRAVGEAGDVAALEWMKTNDLTVDQKTGDISAQGPGWLKTVRRGSTAPLGGSPKSPPAPTKPKSEGLVYFFLEFQRGATGHVHRREIAFADRVRGIYGPVKSWEEELKGNDPRQLGEGAMLLTCDQVKVAQLDVDRGRPGRAPIELEALGNTVVEAAMYTARAERMTYTEAKDLLVLEGTGRTDAVLTRQTQPGAAPGKFAARKILYWRSTQHVDIDDAKFLNVGPLSDRPQSAPRR
jgi:lipopolysaccharide export system protein LptA